MLVCIFLPTLLPEPSPAASSVPSFGRWEAQLAIWQTLAKARVSWQQLLTRPPQTPVLLTDKEGGQLPPEEALDEAVPEYRAPGKKSLLEIQQLDPDDESLVKYKRALLGPVPPAMGMPAPWAWGEGGVGAPVDSGFLFRSKPAQRSGDQADTDI